MANLHFCSSVAKTYTSQHTQQQFGDFINKITEYVLNNLSKFGVDFLDPSETFESSSSKDTSAKGNETSSTRSVRVLDYACGPGTITNILAGRASEFIGIDLSPKMVEEYNERFSSSTSDGQTDDSTAEKINAHAFHANLFDPKGTPESLNDAKFFNFDLVCVSGGYHHFENLPLVTERLVERLRPGGVLAIIDFKTHAPEDMAGHPAMNTIAHHGFTEQTVKQLFGDAGLKDVEVYDFPTTITLREKSVRQPFMARGTKP